jgi:hypothetical protein
MTKKTTKHGPKSHPDPYAQDPEPKPNFVRVCVDNQSFVRTPGVIPAADRLALIDALPNRLSEDMKAPFVDAVLWVAEGTIKSRLDQHAQSIKAEVNEVATQARKLLIAMARMQPDALSIFEAFGLEVAYYSRPPSQAFSPRQTEEAVAIRQKIGQTTDLTKTAFDGPSGSGISKLWDVVQDIETMAHVTAANIAPQRGKRPGDSLSKAIIRDAAHQYKLKFSTPPPLSEWFAVWLSDLGGKLGHPFSAKQAATALAQWRADQDPAGKVID